jgi:hypothetical protein
VKVQRKKQKEQRDVRVKKERDEETNYIEYVVEKCALGWSIRNVGVPTCVNRGRRVGCGGGAGVHYLGASVLKCSSCNQQISEPVFVILTLNKVNSRISRLKDWLIDGTLHLPKSHLGGLSISNTSFFI